MTNPSGELKRRLELATSTDENRGAARDEQVAMLREGWSVLGELLESTGPIPDPGRLVRQVRSRIAARRRRLVGWMSAACLLLAIAMAAPSKVGSDPIAKRRSLRASVQYVDIVGIRKAAGWHDELDVEIAKMREDVIALESRWNETTDSFAMARRRLDDFETRLNHSSL